MWRVVVDSTMDLPPEDVRRYGIVVVPIHIHFGRETFLDRVTISEEEFYARIAREGVIPKTSQPSVGEFVETYRRLAAEGASAILSAHISSHLSGTYESARQAADIVKDEIRVEVFDSWSGSGGLGFMAREAAELAEKGAPIESALERLSWMREVMRIYLMLDNLKFAQMSGRVTFVQQMAASLLRLKPIVAVRKGYLEPADKVRTVKRALGRLVSLVADEYGDRPVHVAVMHAQAPERAKELLELARDRLDVVDEMVTPLATSIAVHFGPGTVGIVSYPAE